MSLINKMLQDLDARGSQGAEPMPGDIKPVPRAEQAISSSVVLIALLAAGALAAAGMFGWRYYQQRTVVPAPQVAAAPVLVIAPPVAAVAAPAGPVTTAVPPPVATMSAPVAMAAPPHAKPAPTEPALTKPSLTEPAPASSVRQRAKPTQKAARPVEYWGERAVARNPVAAQAVVGKVPAQAVAPRPEPAPAPQLSGQRGEGEYRRALTALAEGRSGDAIAALEQTLRLDARHDAARQTLIGLLIEQGRADDAMRQLHTALAADPRQPALAMLLARMQIERGESGIDTLTRTLPAAAGSAEYHAFLAGALQRAGRNREAAEQFDAALRGKPQQGVWLMGLGIALQADQRNAEAIQAFERAKASGALSPDLLSFVERRLVQLAR